MCITLSHALPSHLASPRAYSLQVVEEEMGHVTDEEVCVYGREREGVGERMRQRGKARARDRVEWVLNEQCGVIYLCARAQTHTHAHTHTRARAHTHTHIHTHAHARERALQQHFMTIIKTRTHICTSQCKHIHTYTRANTHTQTQTHTHTHTHTHTRKYTDSHTHWCVRVMCKMCAYLCVYLRAHLENGQSRTNRVLH